MSGSIEIRLMRQTDIPEADRIMRHAFGTFLGLPNPLSFMGDAGYVKTRYTSNPSAALVAEVNSKLAGSNFALNWGSVGIFGPLTIHPGLWNKGVAKRCLKRQWNFSTDGKSNMQASSLLPKASNTSICTKVSVFGLVS